MPLAVKSGVHILEYWDMTLGEINTVIEAYNSKIEQQHMMNYEVAALVADFVNRGLNGKKIPPYNEVFNLPETQSKAATDFQVDQWRIFAEETRKHF